MEPPLEKFCTVLMAYDKSTPPNEVRMTPYLSFELQVTSAFMMM